MRRTVVAFALISSLLIPTVARAESARPAQALAPAGLGLLQQIWSALRSLWSEEGCNIDPSGRCGS
ncbi:MAG TPA: hypothetical protein VF173_01160 [Thermoanaerobaculia bacterium]|nr:hypothetical protein [Thermoanaerobaculia bacterium]